MLYEGLSPKLGSFVYWYCREPFTLFTILNTTNITMAPRARVATMAKTVTVAVPVDEGDDEDDDDGCGDDAGFSFLSFDIRVIRVSSSPTEIHST